MRCLHNFSAGIYFNANLHIGSAKRMRRGTINLQLFSPKETKGCVLVLAIEDGGRRTEDCPLPMAISAFARHICWPNCDVWRPKQRNETQKPANPKSRKRKQKHKNWAVITLQIPTKAWKLLQLCFDNCHSDLFVFSWLGRRNIKICDRITSESRVHSNEVSTRA